MDYISGASDTHTRPAPLSRLQEKEELQRLADKFSAYVGYVRQLNQHACTTDPADFVTVTQVLDKEIANLKSIYEAELGKLRNDIEVGACARSSLQTQCSNQQTSICDLQNKLSHETNRNTKLLTEVNVLCGNVESLESELQAAHRKLQSQENVDQLKRCVDNLTREVDQWKHRFEHEQLSTRELENRLQQMLKKSGFSDQVHEQEIKDYKNRMDLASATIISLEARLQDLNKVPISEVMKQVKEKVEAELRSYQAEAEEQYTRNLSVLKGRIDSDAEVLQKLSLEKGEFTRKIGELQDRIRNLEGQIASLQHQKKTLEDARLAERRQAEGNIGHLEKKFRDVQDMLMEKINEVVSVRESSIPLKAEIEALKVLMEEEENRLQVPLGLLSSTTAPPIILKADSNGKVLKSNSATTPENKTLVSSTPAPVYGNLQTSIGIKKVEEVNTAHSSSQPMVSLSSITADVPAPRDSFITKDYNYSSSYHFIPEVTSSVYPFEPSPPLDTFYIPEELQLVEDNDALTYNVNANGLTTGSLNLPEVFLPMTGPQYSYSGLYDQNQLNSSPTRVSCPVGPVHARVKSAAENHKTEEAEDTEYARNFKINQLQFSQDSNLQEGKICQYFNKDELITKSRPKSSPAESLHSFPGDLDPTTSAIGDLKIKEVSKDGRFVSLLNDGPTEYECSGYIIKQTIHGRPVGVFRFPSDTKFPPDSTITVWSAMNDPSMHNPPTDFFWKESQKWENGSQCTTVLCRPNGQAVAWTIASHRFSIDPFMEPSGSKLDLGEEQGSELDLGEERKDESHSAVNNIRASETLTAMNVDLIGPGPEPVFIRREKRQPASLFISKHPHGSNPSFITHPHTGQARPLRLGNDNSTYSRQSRAQTIRPDPLPGQPYIGSPAQRIGSKTLRRTKSSQTSRSASINENIALNKTTATSAGKISERPSPFSRPWGRFETGLKQIYSQHNPDFLPPMPQPPQVSW